jgi:hypothetical protein
MQQDNTSQSSGNKGCIKLRQLLPEKLAGQFFGVGSLGEKDHKAPLRYIKQMALPYSFQITAIREEDMIRQFGAAIDRFEEEGNLVLDVDIHTYREIIDSDETILPQERNLHSLYSMMDGTDYPFFKTQQTAPATMCFSIRGKDGKQLLNRSMFRFFERLMERIAKGQVEYLLGHCKNIILCQDDPGLGFVRNMIETGQVKDISLEQIIEKTDSIYPERAIPAYHYCDDWRDLKKDDWYILWDSIPKLVHVDLVRYPPEISAEHAEKMNEFMRRGGGFALGVLPNIDDGYSRSVLETLEANLTSTLTLMSKKGIDMDLMKRNSMISTQCGLSGASIGLTRAIHEESIHFKSKFIDILERTAR